MDKTLREKARARTKDCSSDKDCIFGTARTCDIYTRKCYEKPSDIGPSVDGLLAEDVGGGKRKRKTSQREKTRKRRDRFKSYWK